MLSNQFPDPVILVWKQNVCVWLEYDPCSTSTLEYISKNLINLVISKHLSKRFLCSKLELYILRYLSQPKSGTRKTESSMITVNSEEDDQKFSCHHLNLFQVQKTLFKTFKIILRLNFTPACLRNEVLTRRLISIERTFNSTNPP